MPGYPAIGHMSGYPGISQNKSGYGRMSIFQMKESAGRLTKGGGN